MNPYDRRVWDYCVSVAEAAADAGFDQIMFDYRPLPVRRRHRERRSIRQDERPRGRVIAGFVAYAKKRLEPRGVRVSTALFGLSATARPRHRTGAEVHLEVRRQHLADVATRSSTGAVSWGSRAEQPAGRDGVPHAHRLPPAGEGIARPARALGAGLELPSQQVLAQIAAARLQGAKGYLLWNASGIYTKAALAPARTRLEG